MDGNVALTRGCAAYGLDGNSVPRSIVRDRAECLVQLLSAFRDIADFDDIHQAAERLDAVQTWIRREARDAAADPLFEDEYLATFNVAHASA
jgi:hypothetical protein